MSTADKLAHVTRHANTVHDLAAEGRDYGDDYMAALETSAADVPDLVKALRAVLEQCYEVDSDAEFAHGDGREGQLGTSVIRRAIEDALS